MDPEVTDVEEESVEILHDIVGRVVEQEDVQDDGYEKVLELLGNRPWIITKLKSYFLKQAVRKLLRKGYKDKRKTIVNENRSCAPIHGCPDNLDEDEVEVSKTAAKKLWRYTIQTGERLPSAPKDRLLDDMLHHKRTGEGNLRRAIMDALILKKMQNTPGDPDQPLDCMSLEDIQKMVDKAYDLPADKLSSTLADLTEDVT